MCARRERELHIPLVVVDPISRLHFVRIDVREPADPAPDDVPEELAVLLQQRVIPLAQANISMYSQYDRSSPAGRKGERA